MLVLEPVLPDRPFLNPIGYLLAKLDRGRFVRPDAAMRSLFGQELSEVQSGGAPWYYPVQGGAYRLRFEEPVHCAILQE